MVTVPIACCGVALRKAGKLSFINAGWLEESAMTGANGLAKLRWHYALGLLIAVFVAGYGMAQGLRPNEREAKPQVNVQDKDDIRKADSKIWVLELKFYDPRLITVDIPGRGRKLCWYVKYQVT